MTGRCQWGATLPGASFGLARPVGNVGLPYSDTPHGREARDSSVTLD
ncbi:hypothetical protein [Ensifer sp. LCM 4579]|nr:hypothetical protein [Ensifer sp. LCM 4579]